jgi:hypothetical protein
MMIEKNGGLAARPRRRSSCAEIGWVGPRGQSDRKLKASFPSFFYPTLQLALDHPSIFISKWPPNRVSGLDGVLQRLAISSEAVNVEMEGLPISPVPSKDSEAPRTPVSVQYRRANGTDSVRFYHLVCPCLPSAFIMVKPGKFMP